MISASYLVTNGTHKPLAGPVCLRIRSLKSYEAIGCSISNGIGLMPLADDSVSCPHEGPYCTNCGERNKNL